MLSKFWLEGFALADVRLNEATLERIESAFTALKSEPGLRLYGDDPRISDLTMAGPIRKLAEIVLDSEALPVRAILFRKSADANWLVPWHQDVTLACEERFDREGYENWTRKDGMWHVHPPVEILERMVALRIHLDDCGPEDGLLRVIPETHMLGKLGASEIDRHVLERKSVTLTAKPGEIIAMHPLLLHSSPKATGTSRRRVLHVEYIATSAG